MAAPNAANVKKALAKSEPSTHGTKRTSVSRSADPPFAFVHRNLSCPDSNTQPPNHIERYQPSTNNDGDLAMPLLLPVLIGIPVVLGGTWMIYAFAK